MPHEPGPLQIALSNGRTVGVSLCRCGHCNNEWYVPSSSEEFFPVYCCYCGIKFVRREDNDLEMPSS